MSARVVFLYLPYIVSIGMVFHYRPCLLVCCLIIGHVFWLGTSLSDMPSGMVPTIGLAFSCGASLSALSVDVVSHYRPCLLAWNLTIGHACWSIATATDNLTSRVQMEEGWS